MYADNVPLGSHRRSHGISERKRPSATYNGRRSLSIGDRANATATIQVMRERALHSAFVKRAYRATARKRRQIVRLRTGSYARSHAGEGG